MRKLVLTAVAAAAATLLCSCAPEFNPPPGYQGGYLWNTDESRTIIVGDGDTLYAISQRYDVPSSIIIARNGLWPPYALSPGQQLVLDPSRTYRVQGGETLASIARQHNVSPQVLAEVNELHEPYHVHPGQELWIPDPFTVAASTSEASIPLTEEPPTPVPGSGILPSTGAPAGATIQSEALPPPPGAAVMSPTGPATMAQVAPQSAPVAPPPLASQSPPPQPAAPPAPLIQSTQSTPVMAPPVPPPPPPLPPPASTPSAPPQLASTPPANQAPPAAEPNLPPATGHFIWPVKGRLLSGFGPTANGLHSDGINIAAPAGTQVRAVDNGVVAYAGDELKGFGNLLLIRHSDGLITAYAHSAKLLVAKGDVVKQGQVVATVGKTGNVDSPQLHFEVRKGTEAVDPEQYLPQTAH